MTALRAMRVASFRIEVPDQTNMEAQRVPYMEDGSLLKGPSSLQCEFGGGYKHETHLPKYMDPSNGFPVCFTVLAGK